jgi:hypothetical protein
MLSFANNNSDRFIPILGSRQQLEDAKQKLIVDLANFCSNIRRFCQPRLEISNQDFKSSFYVRTSRAQSSGGVELEQFITAISNDLLDKRNFRNIKSVKKNIPDEIMKDFNSSKNLLVHTDKTNCIMEISPENYLLGLSKTLEDYQDLDGDIKMELFANIFTFMEKHKNSFSNYEFNLLKQQFKERNFKLNYIRALIKDHKPLINGRYPARGISSMKNNPIENLSIFMGKELQKLFPVLKFRLINADNCLKLLKETKNLSSLLTFDLKNYYPSISLELGLAAVKYSIKKYNLKIDAERQKMLIDLIKLIRTSTYQMNPVSNLPCKNKTGGISLGTSDGCIYSDIVGNFLIESFNDKFPEYIGFINLYRDDGLLMMTENAANIKILDIFQLFQDHCRSWQLEVKMENLVTKESNKMLSFLDLKLGFSSGIFAYDLYIKPGYKFKQISPTSGHKPCHLQHVPETITNRIARRSQNFENFSNNLKKFPILESKLAEHLKTEEFFINSNNGKKKRQDQRRIFNCTFHYSPYIKNIGQIIYKHFRYLMQIDKY